MNTIVSPRFVEVAVAGMQPGSASATLTYTLPHESVASASLGALVWVPLRNQTALGVIVAVHDQQPDFEARPILEILPAEVALTPEQIDLGLWLQRETASSLYACLNLWLPPGIEHTLTPWFDLRARPATTTRQQTKVLDLLAANGAMSLPQLQKEIGSSLTTIIRDLERTSAISRRYLTRTAVHGAQTERWLVSLTLPPNAKLTARQREVYDIIASSGAEGMRTAELIDRTGASSALLAKLESVTAIGIDQRPLRPFTDRDFAGSVPTLTEEQALVWLQLEQELAHPTAIPHLLFGVTGSGKTELYLRAIAATLRQGKGAFMLVPEIALTGQIAQRVRNRFPGQVAVLHSGMTIGARQDAWARIESGERSIVVGPRSALFAPIRTPGLYILDEEHDASYKQDSDPRYHARAVAAELAKRNQASLILGSATPATETLWAGQQGEIIVHRLIRRAVATAPDLPPVQIVDIRQELGSNHTSFLSRPLIDAVQLALDRNEQSMLLLNRRGMATVVICRSCGHSVVCPNCEIPLVFHQDRRAMICHRCDHREAPRQTCAECGGPLDYFGVGTQRIEAEVRRLFPTARVARWDLDTNRKAGASAAILASIEQREIDVIVGTQLIAKGLDLPFVTTVGIVNADVGLTFPDYRSGERTFQLITQMAGRAGRRTPHSRAIVQTYSPDHYALQAASRHDVLAFYTHEIEFRRTYRYPPFVRMIRFAVRRSTDDECAIEADALLRALGKHASERHVVIDVIGPAPAFVSRIRGEAQWHMILRAAPLELERLLDGLPHPPGWVVDIDPVSLL